MLFFTSKVKVKVTGRSNISKNDFLHFWSAPDLDLDLGGQKWLCEILCIINLYTHTKFHSIRKNLFFNVIWGFSFSIEKSYSVNYDPIFRANVTVSRNANIYILKGYTLRYQHAKFQVGQRWCQRKWKIALASCWPIWAPSRCIAENQYEYKPYQNAMWK